jgi:hypothetical protein
MNRLNPKSLIQFGLLFLILVVLPAGSFLYLKRGLDFRKNVTSRMQDYGKLTAFPGDPLFESVPDSLGGRLWLVAQIDPAATEDTDIFRREMRKLVEQFDTTTTVSFVLVLPATTTDSVGVQVFLSSSGILRDGRTYVYRAGTGDWEKWQKQMQWPAGKSPQVAVVTADRQINVYYSLRSQEDIDNLVRLGAMIMPRKKDKELIFKREVEK